MRQRRLRPVSPIAEPPDSLIEFDVTEWGSSGCWREARRQWIAKHGAESLGGWLAVLRAEHQALMSTFDQGEAS